MKNILRAVMAAAFVMVSVSVMAFDDGTNYGKIVGTYDAPAYSNARGMASDVNKDEYDAKASKTGYWLLGGGAAVNSLPLAASKFTLPIAYVAYESINKKSIADLDFMWSFGLYDLMPELEFGIEIPAKPFDFRLSAGAFYDVIIGGTAGALLKGGVIINKTVQFDLMFIPIGTQPSVSYSESLAQQHIVPNTDGKHGLTFPVFGVLVSYRI